MAVLGTQWQRKYHKRFLRSTVEKSSIKPWRIRVMEHLAVYFAPSLITFTVLFLGHCFYLQKKEDQDD